MKILVEKEGDFYRVYVSGDIPSSHLVDADIFNLPEEVSTVDKEQLVKESFEFLLEREPNTSILSRFALSDIGLYFSDYSSWLLDRHRSSDAD